MKTPCGRCTAAPPAPFRNSACCVKCFLNLWHQNEAAVELNQANLKMQPKSQARAQRSRTRLKSKRTKKRFLKSSDQFTLLVYLICCVTVGSKKQEKRSQMGTTWGPHWSWGTHLEKNWPRDGQNAPAICFYPPLAPHGSPMTPLPRTRLRPPDRLAPAPRSCFYPPSARLPPSAATLWFGTCTDLRAFCSLSRRAD